MMMIFFGKLGKYGRGRKLEDLTRGIELTPGLRDEDEVGELDQGYERSW